MGYQDIYARVNLFLPYYVVIFMAIELIYLSIGARNILLPETKVNIASGLIVIVTQYLLKTSIFAGLYSRIYDHRVIDAGTGPFVFVYCFFLFTFLQYVIHYINHKVRLFWCLHEVHHSATRMNTSTGIRSSIFDVVAADALYFLVPFLGVPPIVFLIVYGCSKFWGHFLHINEKIVSSIPAINHILVDPANHHIHHARNIPYLDKNFGEIVPWYDKMFNTFEQTTEPPIYGTLGNDKVNNFWDTQLYEWRKLRRDIRATKNLKHKLLYICMPPGWSPNGTTSTVSKLQKEYEMTGSECYE